MKRFYLACALVLIWIGCLANPIVPEIISRVWFDDTGDLHLQFGSDCMYVWDSMHDLTFTTSAGNYTIPESISIPDSFPFNINASELIPGFTADPQSDSIVVRTGYGYTLSRFCWGDPMVMNNDLCPFINGQSAVRVRVHTMDGDWFFWAKESSPDETTQYETNSRCTFYIHVVDLNNNPVPNYPVFYHLNTYAYYYTPDFYTDAQGNVQIEGYAARSWIGVRDWDNLVLFEHIYLPEPDEVTVINVVLNTVAGNDPVLTPHPGALNVYPNVLNDATHEVKVSYDQELTGGITARLYLYDLRGRELLSLDYSPAGETLLHLPDLDSGVYFLSLRSNRKELGRQKLVVIK